MKQLRMIKLMGLALLVAVGAAASDYQVVDESTETINLFIGQLERTEVVFADHQHLMRIIQRVVSRVGRRVAPELRRTVAPGSQRAQTGLRGLKEGTGGRMAAGG